MCMDLQLNTLTLLNLKPRYELALEWQKIIVIVFNKFQFLSDFIILNKRLTNTGWAKKSYFCVFWRKMFKNRMKITLIGDIFLKMCKIRIVNFFKYPYRWFFKNFHQKTRFFLLILYNQQRIITMTKKQFVRIHMYKNIENTTRKCMPFHKHTIGVVILLY
jgi:hypothetical protein